MCTSWHVLPLQYIHHRLIHLTPADYDDFVNIIRSARSAFCLTPVGMMQFNDVLQNLKRGKQTKELWQRISLEMATFSPWAAHWSDGVPGLGPQPCPGQSSRSPHLAPTQPPAFLLPLHWAGHVSAVWEGGCTLCYVDSANTAHRQYNQLPYPWPTETSFLWGFVKPGAQRKSWVTPRSPVLKWLLTLILSWFLFV